MFPSSKALEYKRDVNDISQFVSKCLLQAKSGLKLLLPVVSMFQAADILENIWCFSPENASLEMILKLSSKLNVCFGAFWGKVK